MARFFCLLLLSHALLTARADEGAETSFRALFETWYAENPPPTQPADATAQALLRRHRPEVFLAPDQTRFIDFYSDYVGNGYLRAGGRRFEDVTQALLNEHMLDPAARFVHKPVPPSAPPTAYARYDRGGFSSRGRDFDFEFLTYNYVFAHSGLPRGLRWWQRMLAAVVGGNRDWHQLDHYVAATVALFGGVPIAVTLQQHNYLTTWRIPADLELGANGRIQLDFAIGSNELYPHTPERTRHPAVSFVTPDNIDFVITGDNRPLFGAYDITDGQQSVEYRLAFLPPSDAFYGFRGYLGVHRRLPGRGAPPGADYNTLPGVKPYPIAMAIGWRGKSVDGARETLRAVFDGWQVRPEGVQSAIDRFAEAAGLHDR